MHAHLEDVIDDKMALQNSVSTQSGERWETLTSRQQVPIDSCGPSQRDQTDV